MFPGGTLPRAIIEGIVRNFPEGDEWDSVTLAPQIKGLEESRLTKVTAIPAIGLVIGIRLLEGLELDQLDSNPFGSLASGHQLTSGQRR
jgi:hypothetical protein